jgi:hypothetical protein
MEVEKSPMTSTIGAMITSMTARNLEADWNLVAHDRHLVDDVGAANPTRWRKVNNRNWLGAVLATISKPFGAAVRLIVA